MHARECVFFFYFHRSPFRPCCVTVCDSPTKWEVCMVEVEERIERMQHYFVHTDVEVLFLLFGILHNESNFMLNLNPSCDTNILTLAHMQH